MKPLTSLPSRSVSSLHLNPLRTLFAGAAVALLLPLGLQAQVVLISEDFNGPDATNLTGKTPTSLDSSLAGETWQGPVGGSAPFDFEQNGDIDAGSNTTYVDVGSIINDAKGTANGVFTLSANFASAPTGNWFAIGFYTNAQAGSAGTVGNQAGILFRDNGDLEGWSGTIVSPDFATGISTETISVELDLSTWDNATDFGTITFASGSASATHNLTSDINWTDVGFGATSTTGTGQILSFELTQVPEPSVGLLMIGGLGLVALAKRRRCSTWC